MGSPILMSDDKKTCSYSTFLFPIKKEVTLQIIEKKIIDDLEYKYFLVDLILKIDAYTLVDYIRKTMKMLFDDEFLLDYTVLKSSCSKKKDFLDLNTCCVIFKALNQRFQNGSLGGNDKCYSVYAKKIKAHISQAAYRISKRPKLYNIFNSNKNEIKDEIETGISIQPQTPKVRTHMSRYNRIFRKPEPFFLCIDPSIIASTLKAALEKSKRENKYVNVDDPYALFELMANQLIEESIDFDV